MPARAQMPSAGGGGKGWQGDTLTEEVTFRKRQSPYRSCVRMGMTEGSCKIPCYTIADIPSSRTQWFLERSHLHVSNLVVVDAVDIKGYITEEILKHKYHKNTISYSVFKKNKAV